MSFKQVSKGDRVSEYVLVEKLGQGGFGEVWKAEHSQISGKYVAIKTPTNTESMELLKKEAVFQHQLDHPNIVKTIGLDTQHDPPYFIMEYVEGKNLRQFMLDDGILPPPYAIDIAVQILEALAYAHSKNIVHKDIKPENILVEKRRVEVSNRGKALLHYVKITDLGLGMFPGKNQSEIVVSEFAHTSGVRLMSGTLFYMSPEQMVPGRTVDERADIYSVGVVLYEMMTGELPLGMDLPSELNPVVSPELDAICKKALSIDRDLRYHSAREMIAVLMKAKESFLLRLVAAGAPALEMPMRAEPKRLTPRSVPLPVVPAPPPPESKGMRTLEWALLGMVVLLLGVSFWTFTALLRSSRARRQAEVESRRAQPARLAGALKITSNPDGADVWINNRKIGTTPVEWAEARHERMEVRLTREYYQDRRLILDPLADSDRTAFAVVDAETRRIVDTRDATNGLALDLELKRQLGGLRIETRGVEEVAVYIDNAFYGGTPFQKDNLEAGPHTVRLAKEGYETITEKICVSPNSTPLLVASMTPTGGSPVRKDEVVRVTIVSEPQGAKVLISDEERGTTPCSLDLPVGEWDLRLAKEYHEVHRQKLVVGSSTTAVTITLKKVRAKVLFESEPAGATLTLDAQPVGLTPFTSEGVEGGDHLAVFALDGYYEFTYPFKVVDASPVGPIKATLQKIPPGKLTVESEIASEVFIDGVSAGKAPVTAKTLPSGTHRVRLLGVERTIKVEPGLDKKEKFALKDLDMALVPAGEFTYGARDPRPGELYARTVKLPGYYMDKYEVTNALYEKFLAWMNETHDHSKCHPDEGKDKSHEPKFWRDSQLNAPNQPVVGVDYYDAYAYAAWAGKRLPTEQEWEKAARGTKALTYPWGNEWDPTRLNWGGVKKDSGTPATTAPVGSYPSGASPYGIQDMAGNASEWCGDDFDPSNKRNSGKVVRGGSYLDREWLVSYTRWFQAPTDRLKTVGFRCVVSEK